MIDSASAQRAILRAVDQGLITSEELAGQSGLGAWEFQLMGLVHTGLLSPSVARRLLEETSGAGESPAPPGRDHADAHNGNGNGRERFELGELLGQGGMGQVYKAYDTSLKRPLALKFLKGDDPDRVGRFLREAQAQARVDHENVCKVYEVGETGGKPYIAMQLIQGQPLFISDGESSHPSPALQEMTVEQKVRLMQKVAEGIHAAHREGLIHRDIKPSNIMLERTEAGEHKPYVLDFGLAREVASAGVTSLGLAAGTPNYMAPEQARGEAGALDRRTDVYGLGATLYALLAGKPPFEGPSSLDVLVKVTEAEAPALQGVAEDLRTIVSKALQKDAALRYDSARALAEDLGRYLGGDPILARKTSLSYRLIKKARKHRKLVAVGAAATLAFVVLGALSLRAQLQAQKRTRLAGVFGQEVKAIESQMRIAHLLPEHDITPERAAVRQRMGRLEAQVNQIGRVAEGPGHYALGRGHLALQAYDKAREHLELAWSTGYQEREVAYALGQALGALYQRELEAAERIADKKEREARKQKVQAEYRDPALRYLGLSRGLDVESPEYVEALVAFYEKRYDEALQKTRAAFARNPSLYEAKALEADIHAAVGTDQLNHGQYDSGRAAIREAEASYASALVIGRSDPSLPEAQCRLTLASVQLRLYGEGGDVEPVFRRALDTCDLALRIDPESADAYSTKAKVLWRLGEREKIAGRDPREVLARSVEAAQSALRLRPGDGQTYREIGTAYAIRADYELARGIDTAPAVADANRYLEQALKINPNDYVAWCDLGVVNDTLAEDRAHRGLDPSLARRRGEQGLLNSLALQPDYDIALRDVAIVSLNQARYELSHGEDPSESLTKALSAAQRAVAGTPKSQRSQRDLARVHEVQAEYDWVRGQDLQASVQRAVEAYGKAIVINEKYREALAGMARLQRLLGRDALEHGRDPQPFIDEGFKWTRHVRESAPDHPADLVDGRLAYLQGRWDTTRRRSPAVAFAHAQASFEKALETEGDLADVYADLTEVQWRRIQWQRSQAQPVQQEIARGLITAGKALAINPTFARALGLRGALYLEQASIDAPNRPELRAKGRESLEQALSINRYLTRDYGPLLEQVRK
jgi:serine/threonine-protein kinase